MLLAPEVTGPVPGCSELLPPPPQLLLLLQPGEEEEAGARGGVGVGQTEGFGESMGGVGGLVRGVRGPAVRRGPFNCGSGCGSSAINAEKLNVKHNAGRESQPVFYSPLRHRIKQLLAFFITAWCGGL